ncbi:heme exporter protein B [Constrictibacter sp. MBR-5]|uniref:heme exporter protein CcmB n=1 Tax=Constrictibacter sp. MBR-5 TaxID=3156467 RepID=UPI0033976DA4
MSGLVTILRRDLALASRRGSEASLALLFFVLGTVLFPLGIGPDPNMLARAGAGLLWVMALLASLLSIEKLFQADWEDGSLDLLVLSGLPLAGIVLAKTAAHWLVTGLPMAIASPLLALLLNVDAKGVAALSLALLLGTPTLSLIGAVGAALTVGARRGGVLLTLLVLPLYIPVLIFGAGAAESAVAAQGARAHLLVLAAFLLAALPLCPWAAGAALRQSVE